MPRQEFYPAVLGAKFATSLPWAVFLLVSGVAGFTAVLVGSWTGKLAIAGLGALLLINSLEGFYRWYNTRQPLVVVEEDTLLWRRGLLLRRHNLADLALSPDPFDLTVLRLQTRSGKFLRLPRDGVARAAELEKLLQARFEPNIAGSQPLATRPAETEEAGLGPDK